MCVCVCRFSVYVAASVLVEVVVAIPTVYRVVCVSVIDVCVRGLSRVCCCVDAWSDIHY